ncbi:MAG: hypothetical protein ABIE43_05950 [Patescibacteria group bacterium]
MVSSKTKILVVCHYISIRELVKKNLLEMEFKNIKEMEDPWTIYKILERDREVLGKDREACIIISGLDIGTKYFSIIDLLRMARYLRNDVIFIAVLPQGKIDKKTRKVIKDLEKEGVEGIISGPLEEIKSYAPTISNALAKLYRENKASGN